MGEIVGVIFRRPASSGIGVLIFILIIAAIGSATSDYEPAEEPAYVYADVANITELPVAGDHSDVLDNICSGNAKDAFGNTYKGPYYDLCSYHHTALVKPMRVEAFTDFATNGHYRFFSGTFFSRARQNDAHKITFYVFADDRLVYTFSPITTQTPPTQFVVDIGNCQTLRIMSSSDDYSSRTNPGVILVDATVYS